MVRPGRNPGDFHSVLSCPRTAARAGKNDDARSGGRDPGVVYETDPARSGPRLQLRLLFAAEKEMAGGVWQNLARTNAGRLPSAAVQSQLRGESRRLVRAEPSGRRFRGDVCGLAHPGRRLAKALHRLESAPETGICR